MYVCIILNWRLLIEHLLSTDTLQHCIILGSLGAQNTTDRIFDLVESTVTSEGTYSIYFVTIIIYIALLVGAK